MNVPPLVLELVLLAIIAAVGWFCRGVKAEGKENRDKIVELEKAQADFRRWQENQNGTLKRLEESVRNLQSTLNARSLTFNEKLDKVVSLLEKK